MGNNIFSLRFRLYSEHTHKNFIRTLNDENDFNVIRYKPHKIEMIPVIKFHQKMPKSVHHQKKHTQYREIRITLTDTKHNRHTILDTTFSLYSNHTVQSYINLYQT